MDFVSVLGIALSLAMDALAVAIVVGCKLKRVFVRPALRLSFHFGLFQFMMPVLGWFVGCRIEGVLGRGYAEVFAFSTLLIIGSKMIYDSVGLGEKLPGCVDPTGLWTLIALSVATSVDALAVGVSLAMLKINIIYVSIVIGEVAALMSFIGMYWGCKLGKKVGWKMEFLGGGVLIVIAFKVLLA